MAQFSTRFSLTLEGAAADISALRLACFGARTKPVSGGKGIFGPHLDDPDETRSEADAAVISGLTFEAPGRWRNVRSVYFDTEDGALAAHGLDFLVHEIEVGSTEGVGDGGRLREIARGQERYLAVLPKASAFLRPIGDAAFDEIVATRAQDFIPIGRLKVQRWSRLGRIGETLVEINLDTGKAERLSAPRGGKDSEQADDVLAASQSFSEIRIELLKGDPAGVIDIARALVTHSHGRVRPTFQTGRDRIDRAGRNAIGKAEKMSLSHDSDPAAALANALTTLAGRVAELVPLVSNERSLEAGWQLRVALRRLRAVERVYRRSIANNSLRDLAERARDYARLVGTARDWDVFLTQTIGEASARSVSPAGFDLLANGAHAARAEAWEAAAGMIGSRSFSLFLLDLFEAATLQPWRAAAKDDMRHDLSSFAHDALERRLDKAIATGELIDKSDPETLHDLRLDLKKLRYTAQMFKGLFAKEGRKPYFSAMSALQDKLGRLNDASVAGSLSSEAAMGQGYFAGRAAGFIAGYHGAVAELSAEDALEAWGALKDLTPYWRGGDSSVTGEGGRDSHPEEDRETDNEPNTTPE